MKYETILFDMDGTVLDTLEDLKDAVNYVLRTNNEPEHDLDTIRRFVGNGMKKLMIRAIPGGEENPTFEKQFQEYQDYYPPHSRIKTKPYDGITEFLEECKARGVKVGIVSNKQQIAVTELAEYYFEGLTQAAVGDGEGRCVKPAKDAPLEAMKRLEANPATTLYVGDSDVDGQTAKNAELDCVLVTWGFRDREVLEKEDHIAIIDSVEELYQFI
ncbi:MAG: HAD family hydrolase [Lachnospiraceae bacterium]|nr:HAD family hydrolase [Lachnospiraceae bacterium]